MAKYLMLFLCLANAFSAVMSGGSVGEIRTLSVTPIAPPEEFPAGAEAVPLAVIRIDNNLPDYEVVLDFPGGGAVGDTITEVSLHGVGGTLGAGCEAPATATPSPGSPGRYVWSPGSQGTATVGYEVRVMVAWKTPPQAAPTLTVSMRSPY